MGKIMSCRLGLNVRGTFTDLRLINEIIEQTYSANAPSSPTNSQLVC